MKQVGSYILVASDRHGKSLFSKIFLASLIIALIFAARPGTSVFAAPASNQNTAADDGLEEEWKNKLHNLRYEGFFYESVRLYPADFEKLSDLALAQLYLEKYGVALRQAQTVIFNHAGFDIEGRITNEKQAAESVQQLAMHLHTMRGLRDKIDEIPSNR